MENAIRFQTLGGPDQHFLHVDVTGRTLKLCRITGQKGVVLSYETIALNQKAPPFRAFDWSPSNESWVAVGQSSGEVSLLRMSDEPHEVYHFQAGKPRLCNAVALSSQNLLAAGLDRVRTDFCLNVWDVQQRLISTTAAATLGTAKTQTEPLHKLAGSEPITSLKFFRDQPRTIVAGVKGQFVRLYDLREPSDTGGLQFATRCVHNISIDGQDENYFASCYPAGDPEISVWDRRMSNRLTSAYVSFPGWSESRQPEVSLELKHAISNPGQIWSLRFSRTRRGCLGVLSSTGQVRVYNLLKEFVSDRDRSERNRKFGPDWEDKYPQLIFLDGAEDVEPPYFSGPEKKEDLSRIVSFDFMPYEARSGQPKMLALTGDGIVKIVSPRPKITAARFTSGSSLFLGSREMTPNLGTPADLTSPGKPAAQVRRKSDLRSSQRLIFKSSNLETTEPNSSFASQIRHQDLGLFDSNASLPDLLLLLSTPRFRCLSNYFLNPTINQGIVSDSLWLQSFWKWVSWVSHIAQANGMVQDNLDFSYLGIYALWMEEIQANTREIGASTRIGNIQMQIGMRIELLAQRLKIDSSTTATDTLFPFHRQLCLYVAALPIDTKDVEKIVRSAVSKGQYTHAAAVALFCDEQKLSYEALRAKGTGQNHKMLAMAIAGARRRQNENHGDTPQEPGADSDWADALASLSVEQTDPYARAILTYVRTADWAAVVAEGSLPLKYRLLIALKRYSDSDLIKYIKDSTRAVIAAGDVEGIILTGLGTAPGLSLLQNYITRSNDLQTAVLAVTVGGAVMKYNYPDRGIMRLYAGWRAAYANALNSWGLKFDRVRFEMAVQQGAVTSGGDKLIEPAKPQIKLVCGHCNGSLAQFEPSSSNNNDVAVEGLTGREQTAPNHSGGKSHPTRLGLHPTGKPNAAATAAAFGTACPKCGRHLPPCGVCHLWLGTPDPSHLRWYTEPSPVDDAKSTPRSWSETMSRMTVFCTKCHHGFHANHARDWFQGYARRPGHRVCPVSDCGCLCGIG